MLRIFILCCNNAGDKNRALFCFLIFAIVIFFLYGPFEGGD